VGQRRCAGAPHVDAVVQGRRLRYAHCFVMRAAKEGDG
jgi:hypothetical protein